ncbi:MAG: peroxiredoxin [Bdellovibrionaceae bacterium]|nr:peroxiredoxin [Bdellovibrio sp.]
MKIAFLVLSILIGQTPARATEELKVNDKAPLFTAQTQDGKSFDLNSRKGKWTVLYFYPKAGTPGCTKQACAFRDSISSIRALGAEVYGISSDTVKEQAGFHKEHHLNFDLLADPDDKIINSYGTKMPMVKLSKRWTFIVDPELRIKNIMKDVDPVLDSERVAKELDALQKTTAKK